MKINVFIIIIYSMMMFGFTLSCSDYIHKLPGGYFFRNEGDETRDILCTRPEGGEIPATVISYDYCKDFIIAKQRLKIQPDPMYKKEYDFPNNTDYYWIIVIQTDSIIGPVNYSHFANIRKLLGVPARLNIE